MDWTALFDETEEEEREDDELEELLDRVMMAPRVTRLVSVMYKYHHHHHHHPVGRLHHQQHAPIGREEGEEDFTSHRLYQLFNFEEGDGRDDDDDESSLSASYCSSSDSGECYSSSYTLAALYYLTINYILGVGCLGVPYAFSRAGFLLCGSIIIIVTVMSYVTVMWVAEAGERFELCVRSDNLLDETEHHVPNESAPLLGDGRKHERATKDAAVATSKYEVVDLISYYLAPYHKSAYQLALLSLMYIGLLAYSQVFCGAVAAVLPSNVTSLYQYLPQIIFGSVVIPLSCTELDEQVSVQAVMALVRFVAIFIMVGGSLMGLFLDSSNGTTTYHRHPPYLAQPHPEDCSMSYTICISGFGVAFSTSLFSQLFQHSVPGLVRPLRQNHRYLNSIKTTDNHSDIHSNNHNNHKNDDIIKKIPFIFAAALLTTCSFYILLGTTAASYFGAQTKSSVNLNFQGFEFGLRNDVPQWLAVMCRIFSDVVVMFPAIDTLSVFPLIAITLGNNLMAACGSMWFVKVIAEALKRWSLLKNAILRGNLTSDVDCVIQSSKREKSDGKKLMQHASSIGTVLWRLIASIPPLVGSIYATDLSFSLLLAGVAGIYVAFVAPCLIQLSSTAKCLTLFHNENRLHSASGMVNNQHLLEEKLMNSPSSNPLCTIYSGWYSKNMLAYPILLFAAFALGVVVLEIRNALILTST